MGSNTAAAEFPSEGAHPLCPNLRGMEFAALPKQPSLRGQAPGEPGKLVATREAGSQAAWGAGVGGDAAGRPARLGVPELRGFVLLGARRQSQESQGRVLLTPHPVPEATAETAREGLGGGVGARLPRQLGHPELPGSQLLPGCGPLRAFFARGLGRTPGPRSWPSQAWPWALASCTAVSFLVAPRHPWASSRRPARQSGLCCASCAPRDPGTGMMTWCRGRAPRGPARVPRIRLGACERRGVWARGQGNLGRGGPSRPDGTKIGALPGTPVRGAGRTKSQDQWGGGSEARQDQGGAES